MSYCPHSMLWNVHATGNTWSSGLPHWQRRFSVLPHRHPCWCVALLPTPSIVCVNKLSMISLLGAMVSIHLVNFFFLTIMESSKRTFLERRGHETAEAPSILEHHTLLLYHRCLLFFLPAPPFGSGLQMLMLHTFTLATHVGLSEGEGGEVLTHVPASDHMQ